MKKGADLARDRRRSPMAIGLYRAYRRFPQLLQEIGIETVDLWHWCILSFWRPRLRLPGFFLITERMRLFSAPHPQLSVIALQLLSQPSFEPFMFSVPMKADLVKPVAASRLADLLSIAPTLLLSPFRERHDNIPASVLRFKHGDKHKVAVGSNNAV
jgi:hypothetical protein